MCKKMGHVAKVCNRGVKRQVWKAKEVRVQPVVQREVMNEAETEFQRVTQSARRSIQPAGPVSVNNSFTVLNEIIEDQVMVGTVPCEADKGEGAPLLRQMDSILIWNVQGINSLMKQKEVKKMINIRSLGMVSLIETKVKAKNMGKMYQNLFAGWCFYSNSSFHSGGRLTLSWTPLSFQVDIRWISAQLINCFN